MSRAKSLRTQVRVALLFLLLLCVGQASAEPPTATLLQQLRKGGYVLLMRHASSPINLPDKQSVDPGNVAFERQLDETGRKSAVAMGRAIQKLGIPIGAVLSSPTYRALQTVRLAGFRLTKTYSELGDEGHSMQASTVSNHADWLRKKVSEPPGPGANIIIVTHMPNIVASFGEEASNLSDGETLVYRPGGGGNSTLIARIKIEDWPTLAQAR